MFICMAPVPSFIVNPVSVAAINGTTACTANNTDQIKYSIQSE